MPYYSQNDEERVILEYFLGQCGTFLDVGAYDGVRLSNTRALLEQGWKGVYVEPSARNILSLHRNCANYENKAVIVQAAVSDRRGIVPFHIDTAPDREWSTTINADLLHSGSVINPMVLRSHTAVIRMDDLSQLARYDFISIDAEWEDMKILIDMASPEHSDGRAMLDYARLICIEARNLDERRQMHDMLHALGFSRLHDTKENLLMARSLKK